MQVAAIIGLVFAGALVALGCGYLALLSAAALRPLALPRVARPRTRLHVIVPAHDEAESIEEAVASLHRQTLPRHLYRVVVVADNCNDQTAALAERAGASVLVRTGDPGKGQALAWAISALLAQDPPDAFVIVDADSRADPDLLEQLAAAFEAGAGVIQADYVVRAETDSASGRLRAAAILLFNRVRNLGRARLGLPAPLLGNGILIGADVVRAQPWDAFTITEDLEYTIRLRLAGVKPRFLAGSSVEGRMPVTGQETEQRLRWEGGRLLVVRRYLGRLLVEAIRRRDPDLVDAAFDLAIPPITILLGVAAGGTAVASALMAAGAVPAWVTAPWLAALVLLAVHVVVGLAASAEGREGLASFGSVPAFVLWKAKVYVRLVRGYDSSRWIRSARPGD